MYALRQLQMPSLCIPFLSVCLGQHPTEAFWTKANVGPLYILEVPLFDRIQDCLLSYIGILVANHEQKALRLAIVRLWQMFENWRSKHGLEALCHDSL